MSMIRLSVLKDRPYAPELDGTISLHNYDRRRRIPVGAMDALAPPTLVAETDKLYDYINKTVKMTIGDNGFTGPLVIMVNGFLFDPKSAISPDPKDTDNPHGRIFHFVEKSEAYEQRHHTSSWPLGLGFDIQKDSSKQGLAVAFGWQSQPGFASSLINHFQNFYARAYDNAGITAWVLSNVIFALSKIIPHQPIDLFCHSLGSRVVLRALALLAKRRDENGSHSVVDPKTARSILQRIGRVLILGGAEYVVEARLLCRRLSSWNLQSGPHFYNFVSRENDVLDKLAENFGPRTFGDSQVIGHNGLSTKMHQDYWIDLQIDSNELQDWMRENPRNIEICGDRPDNVWDHWYYFTHRGNMNLYNKILHDRNNWSIEKLRASGVPEGVSRRWYNFGD